MHGRHFWGRYFRGILKMFSSVYKVYPRGLPPKQEARDLLINHGMIDAKECKIRDSLLAYGIFQVRYDERKKL